MENIEQLCISLAAEKEHTSQHTARIARVELEINQAMERTRTYFGDQIPGQEIIRLLTTALSELARADNALYALGNEITTYIAELQK